MNGTIDCPEFCHKWVIYQPYMKSDIWYKKNPVSGKIRYPVGSGNSISGKIRYPVQFDIRYIPSNVQLAVRSKVHAAVSANRGWNAESGICSHKSVGAASHQPLIKYSRLR